ncbi:hypothetical protein [Lentilactobacillus senioris]|nr:hypothetical protein [Lentilactobacillus senioris]
MQSIILTDVFLLICFILGSWQGHNLSLKRVIIMAVTFPAANIAQHYLGIWFGNFDLGSGVLIALILLMYLIDRNWWHPSRYKS